MLPQLAIDVHHHEPTAPRVRDGVLLTRSQACEVARLDARLGVERVTRGLHACVYVELATALPTERRGSVRLDRGGRILDVDRGDSLGRVA